jgi:hypothetical protein
MFMPSPNLVDLMWLYARRGIADWSQAHPALQLRASRCLGTARIAENEWQASTTIHTFFNGTDVVPHRFIPMPKHPKKGIERCFFLPVRQIQSGGSESVSFELLLLVEQTNCLGFRFEPAHARPGHNFAHIQFSRSMLREKIPVSGIPLWMPDTHPAFPVLRAKPLEVFLYMVTSVHGYDTGCTAVLQDICRTPAELAMYLNILRTMLV